MSWTGGWPVWVLSGILALGLPAAAAVVLRELSWGIVGPPTVVLGLAAALGAFLQDRGVRDRAEEAWRDRQLGWMWHHPLLSTLAIVLIHASLMSLYFGLFVVSDVELVWTMWPIFAAATFVGGILGRFMPRSYTGDDPAIPERWRRRSRQAERPIPRRGDPRDPW